MARQTVPNAFLMNLNNGESRLYCYGEDIKTPPKQHVQNNARPPETKGRGFGDQGEWLWQVRVNRHTVLFGMLGDVTGETHLIINFPPPPAVEEAEPEVIKTNAVNRKILLTPVGA